MGQNNLRRRSAKYQLGAREGVGEYPPLFYIVSAYIFCIVFEIESHFGFMGGKPPKPPGPRCARRRTSTQQIDSIPRS